MLLQGAMTPAALRTVFNRRIVFRTSRIFPLNMLPPAALERGKSFHKLRFGLFSVINIKIIWFLLLARQLWLKRQWQFFRRVKLRLIDTAAMRLLLAL